MMPEQVRIVELLQFLQRKPFLRRHRRLAILVSAWDLIADAQLTPDEWLQREMPLLYQFLLANTSTCSVRVYGISAQGGDLTGQRKDDLLKLTPSERIVCLGPHGKSHDLTEPVVWLMMEE